MDFMEQHTLCGGLFSPKADISFSFESKANGHISLINHFLLSENLFEKVITYNCLNDVDNVSDHLPVFMQFKIEICNNNNLKQNKSSINWKNETEEQIKTYRYILDSVLSNVKITSLCYCSNFSCTCDDHKHSLNNLYDSILQSHVSAGNLASPISQDSQNMCRTFVRKHYFGTMYRRKMDHSILTSIRKKQ